MKELLLYIDLLRCLKFPVREVTSLIFSHELVEFVGLLSIDQRSLNDKLRTRQENTEKARARLIDRD